MSIRRPDRFVVAAWAALAFGLLEGALADVLRFMPRLRAPYKASAHQLWITPLSDLLVFLLVAACLPLVWRLARRWASGHELRITWGVFLALGFFAVLDAPGVVHLWSAALLSLGLAVVMVRGLGGRLPAVTAALRRRIVWVPLILVLAVAGVVITQAAIERARYGDLPPLAARQP